MLLLLVRITVEDVTLADVDAVIAYDLRHPEEIETYLAERERQAGAVRQRIESQQNDLSAIRARLRAQRGTRG